MHDSTARTEGPDTQTAHLKDTLRYQLGQGSFDGYLKDAVNRLQPKLPKDFLSREDMLQGMTVYALEAIRDYNPTHHSHAQFTTYLVKHLRVRSLQWFNWAWLPMNHPKDHGIRHLSAYDGPCGSPSDEGFDPEAPPGEDPTVELELGELFHAASDRSRQILAYLLAYVDDPLIEAFQAQDFCIRVSSLTGMHRGEIQLFVWEMRELLPTYISSINTSDVLIRQAIA
jgi:hypothetical protein